MYQNRSNCARRGFSMAVSAIAINASNITYPVHPGPVAKFASKKPLNPSLLTAANFAKLFQCAIVCTQEKKTIDQATSLWKVMFLSNGMMPFKGVRRTIDIKFLHTGKRMRATST